MENRPVQTMLIGTPNKPFLLPFCLLLEEHYYC